LKFRPCQGRGPIGGDGVLSIPDERGIAYPIGVFGRQLNAPGAVAARLAAEMIRQKPRLRTCSGKPKALDAGSGRPSPPDLGRSNRTGPTSLTRFAWAGPPRLLASEGLARPHRIGALRQPELVLPDRIDAKHRPITEVFARLHRTDDREAKSPDYNRYPRGRFC
jgi:hypothetical protein